MFSLRHPMRGGQVVLFFELVLCLVTMIVIPDQMRVPRKPGCELIGDICYTPGDGLALLCVYRLKRQKPMLLRQYK